MSDKIVDFVKKNLLDELYTSTIYNRLSKLYRKSPLSSKLFELAEMEKEHANFWKDFLERREYDTSNTMISEYKASFLTFIYRFLGIGLTLKILEIGERNAITQYSTILKSPEISEAERKHINQILIDELEHEEQFEKYETRYRFFVNQVATIFTQMSGGLVTVLSISVGLAGVYKDPFLVAISGLIVCITGALNTITGFYFFGRTQRQVKLGILNRIKMASDSVPHVFVHKVIDFMKRKNVSDETARALAEEAYEKKFLDKIVAEEEYGIKEETLGNPFKTAIYAGLFRIVGTIFPLVPYFSNFPIEISILISILTTLLMLSVTGFLVAISAEISVKDKIIELIVTGIILTSITFIIGKLTSLLMELFIK